MNVLKIHHVYHKIIIIIFLSGQTNETQMKTDW